LTTFVIMKKLLYLIFPIVLLGCDDGDIITNDFDFEDASVEACNPTAVNSTSNNFVFYKNENTNFESLVLQIQTSDAILITAGEYDGYLISNGTNSFEYRKFNAAVGSDYYCNNIPPSSPVVTEVYRAFSGEISVTTETRSQDDHDGIPAEQEGAIFVDGVIDLIATTQDSDGDGILDYLDSDDDGDNVLTIDEGVVLDANGIIDPIASRNTDRSIEDENILNYLDPDDDDDGVLTINEDINGNLDPTDDHTSSGIANYLVFSSNPEIANPIIEEYREHSIKRINQLSINITNLSLQNDREEIIFTTYPFGEYRTSELLLKCTPNFIPVTGSEVCIFQ
jgi:hypothetical protein